MSIHHPGASSPHAGLDRTRRGILALYAEKGFLTGDLLGSDGIYSADDAAAIVRSFLDEVGPHVAPPDAWRFARALVHWAGPEAAVAGVVSTLEACRPPESTALMLIVAALGTDDRLPLSSPPPAVLAALAEAMWSTTGPGEQGVAALLFTLWCSPAFTRQAIAEALMAIPKPDGERAALAAQGALSPFAPAVRGGFVRALTALQTPDADVFLSLLSPEDLGDEAYAMARNLKTHEGPVPRKARAIADTPLAWPVEAAYATYPDDLGSQSIYIARRRPGGTLALFGGVVNERLGLVEGTAAPNMPTEELSEVLERLGAAEALEVPYPYALARLNAGEATTARGGYPLPLGYVVGRYLLAGLNAEGAPDLEAEARVRYDAALLPHTGAVLHTRAARQWAINPWTDSGRAFYTELANTFEWDRPDPTQTPVFPEALYRELDHPFALRATEAQLEAIDLAARRVFPAMWTSVERGAWADRLRQLMMLFALEGRVRLASAAATAAVALGQGEGLNLGFLTELMRCSGAMGAMRTHREPGRGCLRDQLGR